jgi:hypothetical protein
VLSEGIQAHKRCLHFLHPFWWLRYFACFSQRIVQWWPHIVVVEEYVHMARKGYIGYHKIWWGHGCTTPPCLHWYTTVVTQRRWNSSKWWHIILLRTSFLGRGRTFSYNPSSFIFYSLAQEVLPLTNLLSLQ